MTRRPDSTLQSQDGFVLVTVLLFVVLLAALTSASVFLTRQESQTAVANQQYDRAHRLAQRGIEEMVVNWRKYNLHTTPEWTAHTDAGTLDEGTWSGIIWKVGPLTYFLNSNATVTVGNNAAGAQRQVGMMARLLVPTLDVGAALTTQDSVLTRGSSQIIGTDLAPIEWTGRCLGSSDKPGVLIDDVANVTTDGSSTQTGTPPIAGDGTIADSTFTQFGDDTFNELLAMANKTLPGGVYTGLAPVIDGTGACDESAPKNWGEPTDPSNACGDYFPIVHLNGNSVLKGSGGFGNESRGQGILLVSGDLLLEGRFTYYGIIITSGTFNTASNGNKIVGGVYSGNLAGGGVDVAGSSIIQYSSCAVQWALERSSSARLKPFDERNWMEVSNMMW